jgi:hypothetical protein
LRGGGGQQHYAEKREVKMASAFELNTLVEIAILNVAVSRILTHLAKATPDPNSFLSAELASGTRKPCQDDLLECFAQESEQDS